MENSSSWYKLHSGFSGSSDGSVTTPNKAAETLFRFHGDTRGGSWSCNQISSLPSPLLAQGWGERCDFIKANDPPPNPDSKSWMQTTPSHHQQRLTILYLNILLLFSCVSSYICKAPPSVLATDKSFCWTCLEIKINPSLTLRSRVWAGHQRNGYRWRTRRGFLRAPYLQNQTAWWRWPGSRKRALCRQNLQAGCPRQTLWRSRPARHRERRPERRLKRWRGGWRACRHACRHTRSSSLLFMKGFTTLYVVVKYQGWWVTWTALNRAGNESCRKNKEAWKGLRRRRRQRR